MQFILDYTSEEGLEEIAGNFTVAEKQFGAVNEIELKPDGHKINVNMMNRHEFVRLRIEYEFKKQCAQ